MPKLTLQVIIDTREQDLLEFTNPGVVHQALDTGDYSISGLEHLVAVERKSLPDLLGCCGYGRDRFKRELQRLRAYRYRMLVVETLVAELGAGEWRTQLKSQHVLGSLTSWMADFGLPVWLAGDYKWASREWH